jgi:hypothetical protein
MKKLFSVLTDDLEHCYITGSNHIAIHHVFGGSNRKLSEQFGFLLPLRPDWHNTSNYGVHFNRELDLKFKRLAQTYFEENKGTRTAFRELFGKSWL